MESVIAIDGPSGSGKSTMAKKLAKKLDILYIDTGAMYRALACAAHREGLSLDFENPALLKWLSKVDFLYGVDERNLVSVNGVNLTAKIREHSVSFYASQISRIIAVRNFLVDFQRELAKKSVCVMEGRDIGTIVFPESFCKIFVTASVDVRCKRRLQQLKKQGESSISLEQVKEDLLKRDASDMNRGVAPLVEAHDAIILDTSTMSEEEVLMNLEGIARGEAEKKGVSL